MFWLFFVVAVLLAPATSAFAAPLMPSSTPTMEDVDPGIDETSRARELAPELRRQSVYYRTEQAPGTIIVNTHDRFLYLIMGNGVAMRYGVGVGRDGFQWGGVHNISKKSAAAGDDRAATLSSALDGRRSRQSARRARALYRRDRLPHPRHQRATDDRPGGVVGMLPDGQRRRYRPL